MNRALLLGSTLLFLACSSGSGDGSGGEGTDASADDTNVAANDSSTPGDDTTAPGDDTSGGSDTTTGADGDIGPYPSGPYGNAVGATFPDLQWVGHVDDAADVVATSEPVTSYSMDDVRHSGKAYAFVHVSEFY
jgi:hypothetical protein